MGRPELLRACNSEWRLLAASTKGVCLLACQSVTRLACVSERRLPAASSSALLRHVRRLCFGYVRTDVHGQPNLSTSLATVSCQSLATSGPWIGGILRLDGSLMYSRRTAAVELIYEGGQPTVQDYLWGSGVEGGQHQPLSTAPHSRIHSDGCLETLRVA